jgi:phospholipase/lecithinase/hemolysin
MKKYAIVLAAFVGLVLLAAGPLAGQTFHKYVALGDSITASFQGACLVQRHQAASFAEVIARQLAISDFQQPLFAEGALSADLTKNKCLGFKVIAGSIGVGAVSDQIGPTNLGLPRAYDNLGIPGATTADLVHLTSADPAGNTANKFAAAILRNVDTPLNPFHGTNAVQQALSLQPDLVTLWVGNNDVLGAALTGVALDGVTLTPAASFEADFGAIVGGLAATGRTLVILNIPDVTAIPFATTIPPVVLNPATGEPVVGPTGPIPLLGPGNTAYPCPGGAPACPVPAGTLVTLQAQPLLQQGYGIPCAVAQLPKCDTPLPDGQFIPPATLAPGVLLYPDEVGAIQARTGELNARIASIGGGAGAVLLDIHALFDRIRTEGLEFGGVTLNADFGTGGLFSADGFHPNNIAHAILADEIIKALNAAEGSSIPEPDLSTALFTPDVPPASAVAQGPEPDFSILAGRQLLELFQPGGVRLLGFDSAARPHRPRGGRALLLGDRPGGPAEGDRNH